MANTTYFITENFIKQNGIITQNVDVKDFSPLIQFAAKAFVKKQIGSYFFEDLLTKYNDQTLNADEELMVQKMQYPILWRASAQAAITLTYQLKNKGLQKQDDDNSQAVELKEATFIYDQYVQQAMLFEKEMKDFLIANKADYPVYLDKLNKDSEIKNNECNNRGDSFNEGVGLIII
jgi:hypothetical protein